MDITNYIRNVEDFPKPGVKFKDITPLLAHRAATDYCLDRLTDMVDDQAIDKVVAIESRGFFFGMLLAQRLNAGFVPVRKPGKLPSDIIIEPYELEYGLDALEIHADAINTGEQVLLHDDVLATGGTARAACNLIQRLGGTIVQCNFLIELPSLKGIEKLKDYQVRSLLKF